MADAAAARREARRKRILENSHNRLELIAGKKSSEECSRESSSKYSDHVYETPSAHSSVYSAPINNGVLFQEPESFSLSSEPLNVVAAGDTEITNDFAGFSFSSSENIKKKSQLRNVVTYKYDVVLLALFIQFLYNVFIFETSYFFLPLIIYTITKLIWFPAQSNSTFANAVLLMNGISASKAQKITTFCQWGAELLQDICVYLFTTICIQSLLLVLENYLVVI